MSSGDDNSGKPLIVIADDDPVLRATHYLLEGPGEVSTDWVAAYFSSERVPPERLLAMSEAAGVRGRFAVHAVRGEAESDPSSHFARAAAIVLRRAQITADTVLRAPRLKLVQRLGVRPDGIDLAATRAAGVKVSCIPRRTLAYTAEHAILLMLALSKRIVEMDALTRSGEYDRDAVKPQNDVAYNWSGRGDLGGLYGKTLGIVGLGEVGTLVMRRAQAFDMRVLYFNRRRLEREQEAALRVDYRDMDALLAESDFVSLHARDVPENVGLFGAKAFAAMKPTAMFVNTSRGRLVDEKALYDAVASGRIAGAGLDNHVIEPRPAGDPLSRLANVIMTPHIAGGSRAGLLDEIAVILANCRAAIDGGAIQYAVGG